MDNAGWPDPAVARTTGEFVAAMRGLKRASGLGYRALEKASGGALPRSTLTAILARETLPRSEVVEALARACGLPEDEVARWRAAWRRIATEAELPVPPDAPSRSAVTSPVAEPSALKPSALKPSAVESSVAQRSPIEPASVEPPAAERSGAGSVAAAPRRAEPRGGLAALVPPAILSGSWPLRALAVVLVVIVGLVVAGAITTTIRDLASSANSPEPTGVPTGLPADPPSGEGTGLTTLTTRGAGGWTVLRTGDATLPDEQSVDFETMTVGPEVPGWDARLSERGVKISAPKGVSILGGTGPETAERCTQSPPDQWDSQAGPVNALKPGASICVATDAGRTVLLTVLRAPDSVTPDLVFHYTVWQRS
ncbi:helix-turn-helix domain-containing protein [Hamadaea sp. NPDC051192]|uniref:helix-turn-helix domain-containing protein n=1 Tax=Hamadaea sp. NPDC051192 TaxID=3154940 RepID=UPI003439CAED